MGQFRFFHFSAKPSNDIHVVISICFSGDKPTAAAPPFVFTAPVIQGTSSAMPVMQPEAQERAVWGTSDITFVSESQSQSNCTEQKKRVRKHRRKAPIYWGKKPNKKKTDAKRKLDSDLDLVKGGKAVLENGEQGVSNAEDVASNSGGERSAEEDADKGEETEKAVDANCGVESETRNTDDKDDETKMVENGVHSPYNGDVVLLDSEKQSELCSELNSDSALQIDSEHISQLPEQALKNHVLSEKVSSLQNGITANSCSGRHLEEKECNMECNGEKN